MLSQLPFIQNAIALLKNSTYGLSAIHTDILDYNKKKNYAIEIASLTSYAADAEVFSVEAGENKMLYMNGYLGEWDTTSGTATLDLEIYDHDGTLLDTLTYLPVTTNYFVWHSFTQFNNGLGRSTSAADVVPGVGSYSGVAPIVAHKIVLKNRSGASASARMVSEHTFFYYEM